MGTFDWLHTAPFHSPPLPFANFTQQCTFSPGLQRSQPASRRADFGMKVLLVLAFMTPHLDCPFLLPDHTVSSSLQDLLKPGSSGKRLCLALTGSLLFCLLLHFQCAPLKKLSALSLTGLSLCLFPQLQHRFGEGSDHDFSFLSLCFLLTPCGACHRHSVNNS